MDIFGMPSLPLQTVAWLPSLPPWYWTASPQQRANAGLPPIEDLFLSSVELAWYIAQPAELKVGNFWQTAIGKSLPAAEVAVKTTPPPLVPSLPSPPPPIIPSPPPPPEYIPPPPLPPLLAGDPFWQQILQFGTPAQAEEFEDMAVRELGIRVLATDFLLIKTYSVSANITIHVQARVVDASGVITLYSQRFTYTTALATQKNYIALNAGHLISCTVRTTGASKQRGADYVSINIQRDNNPINEVDLFLAADYINLNQPVSYPASPIRHGSDGAGFLITIDNIAPAVGAEISTSVPASQIWRIHSLSFVLTTSAVVANRDIWLAAARWIMVRALTKQPASTSREYRFYARPEAERVDTEYYQHAPFPAIIEPGTTIQTITTGLAAGDQFSQVLLQIERWLLP